MIKQKYTADDIKKIYEKSLPKVYQAPYKEPVGVVKPASVEKQDGLLGKITLAYNNRINNNVEQNLSKRRSSTVHERSRTPATLPILKDTASDFKGGMDNAQVNYEFGKMNEELRALQYKARQSQEPKDFQAASDYKQEISDYIQKNPNVGQGNWITQEYAQYFPQAINQLKSGLSVALPSAAAAGGTAWALGKAGPQALVPEEFVTVPAAMWKVGKPMYTAGVAKYMYELTAGSTYADLLDMGIDNETALDISNEVAIKSSAVEGAETLLSLSMLGIGKLTQEATKTVGKKVAEEGLSKIVIDSLKKEFTKRGLKVVPKTLEKIANNVVFRAVSAYGVNLLSETAEEATQEKIAIEGEKKATEIQGIERLATPDEDLERIKEAGAGGFKIAAVGGALNAGVNLATNAIYNNQIKNSLPTQEQQTKGKVKIEDIIKQNKEVTQEQHDGRVLPTVNTNKQVDQSIEQVSNVAQKANRGVTDNIQQRQGQIVENVADTDIKISPKYRNKFIRSVSDALGVSKYSNKANINSLSDMLVEEIARGNNIDAQSAEILFNTLMDEGVSVDSEFYNLYKDLKNEIKNTRLYVGDDIRAEYGRGEYNNFKKAHFGKLNLTSDRNNMSVDQYYQELSGRHPELFPENIIVQQDQLGRIADVVNSIVKNEDKLSSLAQNDKEYRQFARAEFDKAINNLKEEVKKETVRKLPTKQEQIVAESQRTLPVKEKKTGIQIDDSSENVRKKNPHVYKYINRLGESVGVKVKFVPEYSFDVKLDDGTVQRNEANGYYDAKENTIVISEGASNPAMVVAKHELTHLMENRSPELYKEYKEHVIDSMKKKGTYQAEVDKLSEAYKGVLSSKDLKAIEDEIVSNASELYLEGDRQSIQEIIDYSPSLAQRVHEFIKNIIDKIKTAMGKDTGAMNISQFRQAEKLWAEMLDDTIRGNAEQSFYENNDVKYSLREEEAPKKTITAYKLFRIDDKTGKLYPLFVSANEEIPQGVWLNADEGERAADTKSGAQKVKSKLGALAYRPGWHSGDIPLATHIGVKGKSGNIEFMNPNHVWAEVEVSADKSYQGEANANGVNPKTGKINYVKADIKKIPVDGYYRYKTNPNMTGEWIISGAMKVNRILSDSEAAEIVRKAGHEPLPRMANEVKVETKQETKFSVKDNSGRQLSKEQQEYFKDSKVRDENGNLLVMYHGTPKGDFTKFNTGTYFTQNKEYANNYQSPGASSISYKKGKLTPSTYEVYLNIEKPFDTRNKKEQDIFNKEYYNKYGMGTSLMESGLPDWLDGMDLQEFIEEQGYNYDGLILDEGATGGYGDDVKSRGLSYVVFDSNQVKNVDNVTPTSDTDIRYKMKEQPDDVQNVMKSTTKLPTKKQMTFIEDAEKRINEAQSLFDDKVADVLTESKQRKLPTKAMIENAMDAGKNAKDSLQRKFIDSGSTVAKVGRIVNDAVLYTLYNNARQSRQAAEYMISEVQTDVMGNKVGDSLKDIFDPIRKKGDDYYKKFSEYMYHMHNVDRMAQGKPVFGESVTAEMSQVKVNEFEYSNPEFIKYAAKVYDYNKNLMQYRIDTGLVSLKQANDMNEMYPNYVPTYRSGVSSVGSRAGKGTVEINQGIKKATGSNKDLLPLHEQMARQTMQVVQAGKRNLFGNRLLSDAVKKRDLLGEYIQSIDIEKSQFDIDEDERTMPKLHNSFVVYTNGKRTVMRVNPGLYEGVRTISSEAREVTVPENVAKAVNSMFKKLVTAYNPMFTIKNVIRDLQDAGIYTKDLKLFTKNFPIAYKEIITNGKKWQQYQALGGFGSSVFDYERGYKQEIRDTGVEKFKGFVKDNTYEKIEALNFWTEQAPRFTEFLSTLEKGDGSYENLMEAMYDSADVTVNFGRSGTWGKVLNSTFVPFFNPSMQGFSKLVRHFTGTRGVKNWTKLVIRVAALGIAPSLVNSLIYDDDDDFDKIHNRDKDINFLLKIGDDQWIKIPKGRVLSLFGNAAQRTLRTVKGEEDAWAGFISTSADNVLPMNPLKNHILSPFLAIGSNTTWYGTPIEGQGLQAFKPGERFDTRTDWLSIVIGKTFNISPKKINYLLDAYTGVIGDFALPLMTKKAETNAFKKQFVLDSTLSNKVSTTFYRKIDDLTYEKNSIEEDNVYDVVYRFMNKQRTAVTDLNREIKAIENSDLSNNEQKTKVKEITAIKTGIQLNALDALEEYQKAAEKNFKKFDNDVDNAYLYTNKDMFGAEYALKTYNKNIYQKYLDSGQSAEEYFEEYFTELFAKREAKAAKEASAEVKIKLPTIKTKGNIKLPTIKTTNIKLPTIKDK